MCSGSYTDIHSYSSEENTLNSYLDEASTYDNNHVYPTFFGYIDDLDSEFASKVSSLIEYKLPKKSDSEELDQVGCPEPSPSPSPVVVNVEDYGAKGDGITNDTEAFDEAWNEACASEGPVLFVIPENKTYLLTPIRFTGPCRSDDLTVQIAGTIEASDNRSDYQNSRGRWLLFENIENLIVEGDGTIDGKGEIWWKNSCKINKTLPCKSAPTALTFYKCTNLRVRNIRIKNAQQMHLIFQKCVNVQAMNLMVTAPGKSPNTDGIHITNTQNIQIMNSIIQTGDDCISIVDGAKNVQATDITCGPGHGISIGSLGADKSEDHVSDVKVDRAKFIGSTNGVRIKTWQGGLGSATNIIFQNILMDNVTNPIIINQNYCDQDSPCKHQGSAVQISNVVYKNIKGTSASKVAINFDCSKKYPCKGILLQDIHLVGEKDKKVNATCNNVRWTKRGIVIPSCQDEKLVIDTALIA
ncbi:hypothetical protein AQUCO_01400768v1 [Aquilegia coerulea]|uniref:endo-polygalacturonase n=1 Tax=Aquilegia coerulea TaxID=218851 RepID=A0A2G5DXZ3_AQUCA|nr:hypothetical protein AQUCO_01400768v1 [Aquilegia coerulea]